jgi:hypothetical protein
MSVNSDDNFLDPQDQLDPGEAGHPNLQDQVEVGAENEEKEDDLPPLEQRANDNEDSVGGQAANQKSVLYVDHGDDEASESSSNSATSNQVRIEFEDISLEPRRSSRRSTSALQNIIDTSRRQSRDFKRTDKHPTSVKVKTKSTTHMSNNPGSISVGLKIGTDFLEVRSKPKSLKAISTIKNYDKTKRHKLKEEDKQSFIKAAGGYVLTKHNKLNFIDITPNAEGALKQVHNLQAQLKALRQHCVKYDIVDTCTIVLPTDVSSQSQIRDETFDIFTDYPKLHPDIVANSCAFYNLWAVPDYVSENMGLIYNLLQSNTDEGLWNKCLEEYEEFEPVQQGGPLMFFLILKQIQDVSENSIQHLRTQLERMKISKVPGENVGVVVSLVKATYKTLKAASSKHHSYIPDDFPKTIFQIFQTSSVAEFNQAFEDEEKLAHR